MADTSLPSADNQPAQRRRGWRWLFLAAGGLALLIPLFYAIENWRGRRAWAQCQQELKAQGEQLDWAAYLPKRVPDEENFIKTPLLEAVAYRGRVDAEAWQPISQAAGRLPWKAWGDFLNGRTMNWSEYQAQPQSSPDQKGSSATKNPAEEFLEAFRDIEPQLEKLRAASLKPHAQFDLDRSVPFEESPGFNLVGVRSLAQVLAFHACAELELNRAARAYADVRVIHRLADGLKEENSLVAMMVRVALQGLALQPVWEGWAKGCWTEHEFVDLEERLARVDLLPEFVRVVRAERAGVTALVEQHGLHRNELWQVAMRWEQEPRDWVSELQREWQKLAWSLPPRGWVCQNLVAINRHTQEFLVPSLRAATPTISPAQIEQLRQRMGSESRSGPYRWLVGHATPNFLRALEVTARTQNQVNQARVVGALERYRKARGQYPDSLAELVPQFLPRPPLDVINGGPLLYRRGGTGSFVLYSVGWNEKDDGGVAGTTPTQPPKADFTRGDWVWPPRTEK